jgi:hypothetical protein
MKMLLLDKLRRGRLVLVLYSLCFFAFGFILPTELNSSHSSFWNNWWFLMYLCFLSSLTSELPKGYGRVVLTLPFTARDIGRFLWFISVAAPTLLLAFFSGFGILIITPFSGFHGGVLWAWIQMVLMGGLLLGSVFWINSGSPVPQPTRQRWIYGILFWIGLVGGGYWLYHAAFNGEAKYAIVCLLGLVFTVLGWQRAEGLVVDYGEYRQTALAEAKSPAKSPLPSGFGGMRFLLFRSVVRQFGWLVAILLFFGFITYRSRDWQGVIDGMPMLLLFTIIVVIPEVINVLLHLKYLRTLPLTSKHLAGAFLVITLLPFLALSAIVSIMATMHQGSEAGLSWFKACIAVLSPVCVVTTAAVWHDEQQLGRIAVVVIVFVISAIAPVYQLAAGGSGLPVWFVISYALGSLALALFAISHLIERNDMTYRLRAQDLQGGLAANG